MTRKRQAARILVVDDEEDILNLLEFNLTRAGFECIKATDGPEALVLASAERPTLVLLDIMLPNMEGTEVLRRLKGDAATRGIPVVMLTAKGEEVDKIVGFELGAEDYITKPFSPRELVLRVKAVLKRASEAAEAGAAGAGVMSAGPIRLDTERHRVTVDGAVVEFSNIEFRLLAALMGSRGRVLTRDVLLDSVWGHDCFVTPRTVDTHVRRVRAKLGPAAEYVETVRGVGYRFGE
ncbi:MAG: response regulator [Thermodesulfobacteriota bacterium]